MKLQKIYASLLVNDLMSAEDWYTRLLGRAPDHRPMNTLIQWELSDQSGVMLSTSDEIAHVGAAFIYIEDLAVERQRLASVGIALEDDVPGDYSTLAQVRDANGNIIILASPPSRPFPAA